MKIHHILNQLVALLPDNVTLDQVKKFRMSALQLLMDESHPHRVHSFMQHAGQATPPAPVMPDEETRIFRAKLIMEETLETIKGLGVLVQTKNRNQYGFPEDVVKGRVDFRASGDEPDMVEIIDGVADISVVSIGTALACGVAIDPILGLVDDANLRKFGPGGYKSDGTDGNPKGKWIKPKDWQAPDIAGCLITQGWQPPEESDVSDQSEAD